MEWMNGWMNEWMNEWMEIGQMRVSLSFSLFLQMAHEFLQS